MAVEQRWSSNLAIRLTSSFPDVVFFDAPTAESADDDVEGGGSAEVRKTELVIDGASRPVALKRLRARRTARKTDQEKLYQRMAKELSIWSRLQHPNIIPLLGLCDEGRPRSPAFVMLWMTRGTLDEYITTSTHFLIPPTLRGISEGVAYLHSLDIVHRDLKATNILMDENDQPHICDFGMSCDLEAPNRYSARNFAVGNPRWTAPESLAPRRFGLTHEGATSKAGDMYALGMTIYEMASSQVPFFELESPFAVADVVVDGGRPEYPGQLASERGLTSELWSMTQRCWAEGRAERPEIADLLQLLNRDAETLSSAPMTEASGMDVEDLDESSLAIHLKSSFPGVSFFDAPPGPSSRRGTRVGSSAEVRRVELIIDGSSRWVALKRLRANRTGIERDDERLYQRMARELSIWTRLQHPNVLPLLGLCDEGDPLSPAFVMPWMTRGTLGEYIEATTDFLISPTLYGIAQGVAYLHSLNIVHRDLKANNIMIDEGHRPHINDFGVSCDLIAPQDSLTDDFWIGNPRWTAPECLAPERYGVSYEDAASKAGDMYALGMTIYEMSSSRKPFSDVRSDYAVVDAVMKGSRPQFPGETATIRGLTPELWSFTQRCWTEDRTERPCIADLLELLNRNVAVNVRGFPLERTERIPGVPEAAPARCQFLSPHSRPSLRRLCNAWQYIVGKLFGQTSHTSRNKSKDRDPTR